jgi:hypothetical protein
MLQRYLPVSFSREPVSLSLIQFPMLPSVRFIRSPNARRGFPIARGRGCF